MPQAMLMMAEIVMRRREIFQPLDVVVVGAPPHPLPVS
jgi:hypothetical protein